MSESEEVSIVATLFGTFEVRAEEGGQLSFSQQVLTVSTTGEEHRVKEMAALSGGSDRLAQATMLHMLITSAQRAIDKWTDMLEETGVSYENTSDHAAPTGVMN